MMNFGKKSTALLTCFCLLFCLAQSAAAKEFTDLPPSVPCYSAVSRLSDLNIIEGDPDGNFRPDASVTRGEMAALICKIMGLTKASKDMGNSAFTDVDSSHWACGYIELSRLLEIVVGHPDGTFGPDDPVLNQDVIKMLATALGYGPMMDQLGGYPTGYLTFAAENGLTQGLTLEGAKEATRGDVAQLINNAIDLPLMEQVGYGADPVYEIMDGKNETPLQTMFLKYGLGRLAYPALTSLVAFADYEYEPFLDEKGLVSCAASFDEEKQQSIFTFKLNDKGRADLKSATEKILTYAPENRVIHLIVEWVLLASPTVTAVIESSEIAVSCDMDLTAAQAYAEKINQSLETN